MSKRPSINYLRELTPEEAAELKEKHRWPIGILGPCTYCDKGADLRNAAGELVCARHRNANAELPPDEQRRLDAWRRARK